MSTFAATWPLLLTLIKSVVLLVVLLIFIAYVLYADRKIWAAVQLRRGPNVVGPWGIWQSFADMLKFVFKEPVIPDGANKGVFLLAPFIIGMLALSAWAVIPVSAGWAIADLNVGILYIFAISSLSVYGIIMGGWASNSKYPFLSALRSAAQMISYEVSIGFVIITVLLCAGTLNLGDIVAAQDTRFGLLGWYWLPLFPMFVIFFISALAETNRPPFDLVEAESELVAGFMVEYSSTPYMVFMLAEYVAIITMCALTTILFLGGWLSPVPFSPFTEVPGAIWFILKVCAVFFMIRHGESHRAKISLRSADAAWLESVSADLAWHGRARCRGSPIHRLERGDGKLRLAELVLQGRIEMKLDQAAKSGFSDRIRWRVLAFDALFLQAETDAQLSAREKSAIAALSRRTCPAALSERRGALHCLQALRGDLPGPGDHD